MVGSNVTCDDVIVTGTVVCVDSTVWSVVCYVECAVEGSGCWSCMAEVVYGVCATTDGCESAGPVGNDHSGSVVYLVACDVSADGVCCHGAGVIVVYSSGGYCVLYVESEVVSVERIGCEVVSSPLNGRTVNSGSAVISSGEDESRT